MTVATEPEQVEPPQEGAGLVQVAVSVVPQATEPADERVLQPPLTGVQLADGVQLAVADVDHVVQEPPPPPPVQTLLVQVCPPEQWLLVHWTQVPLLQYGVEPEHWLFEVH